MRQQSASSNPPLEVSSQLFSLLNNTSSTTSPSSVTSELHFSEAESQLFALTTSSWQWYATNPTPPPPSAAGLSHHDGVVCTTTHDTISRRQVRNKLQVVVQSDMTAALFLCFLCAFFVLFCAFSALLLRFLYELSNTNIYFNVLTYMYLGTIQHLADTFLQLKFRGAYLHLPTRASRGEQSWGSCC